MPKIPTFTTQARPTAEVGDVRSNIQISPSQNIGTAAAPLVKTLMNYAATEMLNQSKNEALELENQSVLELNTAVQQASKLKNKEQANTFLINESKRIRDAYGAKASSSQVRSIFDNNYLKEEQKQIIKVDNAVYKNVVESYANNKLTKQERILTEGLFGKNPLAEQTMINDLTQLELDDTFQDIDTKEKNIAAIPGKIDYFKAKRQIQSDPKQAYLDITNPNKYINLPLKARLQLQSESLSEAKPIIRDEIKNVLAAGADGKIIEFDQKFAKEILDKKEYEDFNERYSIIKQTYIDIQKINNSEIGTENEIVKETQLKDKSYILDKKKKDVLINAVQKKQEYMEKDPVAFLYSTNDKVKQATDDYRLEQDPELQSKKKTALINTIVQEQIRMKQLKTRIKVISKSESEDIVAKYLSSNEDGRLAWLEKLQKDYGEYYSNALNQLSKDGLPFSAEFSSYLGNKTIAKKLISFDTEEKQKVLKQFAKDKGINVQTDINESLQEKIKDFEKNIMIGNQYNTSIAAEKLSKMKNTLSYYALNEILTGKNKDQAINNAANLILDNYEIADTYFIPKIYNGERLGKNNIDKIQEKAALIKDFYLNDFKPVLVKSKDPKAPIQDLIDELDYQMKNNGLWVNTEDGKGIVFGIKLRDGSIGLIENANGENLRIDFNDTSYKIPTTDIEIDTDIKLKAQQFGAFGSYGEAKPSIVRPSVETTMIGRRTANEGLYKLNK